MADARWIGIDVSRATLDVALLPEAMDWQVGNDPAGWAQLAAILLPLAPAGIVLEATGSDHVGVLVALHQAGLAVTVLNPMWAKAFRHSEGAYAKTDRADARLLARYGQQKQPAPTALPSEAQARVRTLTRRREQLVKMRVMEKNRQQTATDPLINASIAAMIAALTEQIREMTAAMEAAVAADPQLAHRSALLQSMPGIGAILSTWLVCALPELGGLEPKALASLAGVAPHPQESGRRHGQRQIRGGRPEVRKALYQAANSARLWNPLIQVWYRHLTTINGLAHHEALIACGHKILRILSAMVRDNLTWTQTKAYQSIAETTAT